MAVVELYADPGGLRVYRSEAFGGLVRQLATGWDNRDVVLALIAVLFSCDGSYAEVP